MKIGAIIQARTSSSRLPSKVLFKLPACGQFDSIDHVVTRLNSVQEIDQIVLATSAEQSDHSILKSRTVAVDIERGSLDNVLERFYDCAHKRNFDHIIRITADSPLIVPAHISGLIEYYLSKQFDYCRTVGLPLGLNAEIFSRHALESAYRNATTSNEREHVTAHIYQSPNQFCLGEYQVDVAPELLDLCLTLDYPADYAMLNLVFEYCGDESTSADKLEEFSKNCSWAAEINRR